jgi:hypothetical protein
VGDELIWAGGATNNQKEENRESRVSYKQKNDTVFEGP